MTLSSDSQKAEVVVTAPSEIDIATGNLLAQRIDRAGALHPDRVIVDFGTVTFCDSTAVNVLLSASARLQRRGCVLVLRNPPHMLTRMAALLGQSQILGLPAYRASDSPDGRVS